MGRIQDELDAARDGFGERFFDAYEQACDLLATFPDIGALYGDRPHRPPTLRCWPLSKFKYVVFYQRYEDEVVIVRVIHGRRDLSAIAGLN